MVKKKKKEQSTFSGYAMRRQAGEPVNHWREKNRQTGIENELTMQCSKRKVVYAVRNTTDCIEWRRKIANINWLAPNE